LFFVAAMVDEEGPSKTNLAGGGYRFKFPFEEAARYQDGSLPGVKVLGNMRVQT